MASDGGRNMLWVHTFSQRRLLAGIPARNYSFPRRGRQNLENGKIVEKEHSHETVRKEGKSLTNSTEYQILSVIRLIFKLLYFYLLLYVYDLTIVFLQQPNVDKG